MTSSSHTRLNQIKERLRRADEHFEWFESKSPEFLQEQPKPYATRRDRQNRGNDVVDVYTFHILESPPLAFSAIISDILHNLRSALDSLVFALGEAQQGGTLPSKMARDSAFPIANRIEDFDPRKIRAVSPDAVTEIERLQPYHRADPETHRLAVLHRLSNLDKHRSLRLAFFSLSTTGWYSERAELLGTGSRLLEDGAEIASFRWYEAPTPRDDVNPSFVIQLVLDEKGTEYLRGASGFLRALIAYVRDDVVQPLSAYL